MRADCALLRERDTLQHGAISLLGYGSQFLTEPSVCRRILPDLCASLHLVDVYSSPPPSGSNAICGVRPPNVGDVGLCDKTDPCLELQALNFLVLRSLVVTNGGGRKNHSYRSVATILGSATIWMGIVCCKQCYCHPFLVIGCPRAVVAAIQRFSTFHTPGTKYVEVTFRRARDL